MRGHSLASVEPEGLNSVSAPYPVFPSVSDGIESAYNAGHLGLIPGLGRSPGEGNGYLLQYSCLENSMDSGAWQAIVHVIAESDMTERLILSAGCLGIRELIICKLHFPHL